MKVGEIMIIIMVICVIVEIIFLSVSFINADEINCNWLWCEFKTTKSTIKENTECYINNMSVDCEDIGVWKDG